MCGIIGMFAFNNGSTAKENKARRESMLYLFTEVLERTRTRGPDATGVSALFSDGDCIIQKGNVKSPEFISNFGGGDDDYEGFINTVRTDKANLQMLVGHCRKSSIGNTWGNENNHPIKAGEIVGVHNGTLKNHEVIFNKLDCERDGEVDSEAIMRLLQYLTNDCADPFTLDTLWETYRRLEGAYTFISFNANNPYQAALMRKDRPMELAIIRSLKLLVVVSEKVFLEEALFDYNKHAMLYGGKFEIIKDDDVDFMTLPLDNVAVIDLTREFEEGTKIPDLLDKVDAFKSNKIWREPASKSIHQNQHWQGRKHQGVAGNNTTTTTNTTGGNQATAPKSSGSTSNKDEDKFPGKVFCKDLNAYVDPNVTKGLSGKGPILLENPIGTIKELNKEEPKPLLAKVDKLTAEKLETPLEIREESTVKEKSVKVEVMDLSADPEVMKAAKLEIAGLTRFENTEELAEALNANNPDTVNSLTPFALANRVKAMVYEDAFIDGATFFSKMKDSQTAQKAVRVAKHVVTVFGKIIDSLADNNVVAYKPELLTHVADLDTTELTKSNIKQVFSKGNLLKSTPLSTLEEVIKE